MKRKCNIIIDTIIFLQLFFFIFSIIISKEISNLDEIWNYNTARQISFGLLPYKDISMITTPLLPTIVGILIKISCDQLFTFRIISSAILTIIFFITYKLFEKNTNKRIISFSITSLILLIFKNELALDYNYLVLLINLIILFIEILFKDKQTKYNFFNYNFYIGLLAGLAFLTKQTVGAFIILEVLLIKFIDIENKKDLKEYFKKYVKEAYIRLVGILVPIILFLIYLLITKSLNDFMDYAILGLTTFSNKIKYATLFNSGNIVVRILSIALPLFLIEEIIRKIILNIRSKKEKDNISDYLLYYSFFLFIIEYPIADRNHFLIANHILLIYAFYTLYKILNFILCKINKKNVTNIIYCLILIAILSVININIYLSIKYYNESDKHTQLNHYQNLYVKQYIYDRTEDINKVILDYPDKTVYVVDAEAAIYDIPLNRYYKNFDMFLNGNIGKDGAEGIINDIKNSNDKIYLIKVKGISLNWQTPKDVINYIRENLEYKGEIGIFEIYAK